MPSKEIILNLLLMVAVFYFFLIMPNQRKAKKEKAFDAALKVGDKIITKAGIHGKIFEISEDSVVIETMSGKIKMERSAISLELTSKLQAKK